MNSTQYTDASKIKDGVWISIILEHQYNISFKLLNTCVIFRDEATAVLKVIKTIIKKEHSQLIALLKGKKSQYSTARGSDTRD